MIALCLLLVGVSFVIAWIATALLVRIGHRLGHLDGQGVSGQIKAATQRVPNTGGVGIVIGILMPMIALLIALPLIGNQPWLPEALSTHLDGISERAGEAWLLIAGVLVLHVLGLIDDRKPLGPRVKLGVMSMVSVGLVLLIPETRILTLLDTSVGGSWLSTLITVIWFLTVINAMNFMDNMDGLTGGVASVVTACFLVTTLVGQQWFISAVLALLLGACLGFLVLNRPPAKIFMGDGGSLVIGLLLAFLTVRTTYVSPQMGEPAGLHSALMPLVVLAVPLYDLLSVVAVRISQGKSPMVGDLQHLSHRLTKRGLSRPGAVGLILGLTAITGIAGMLLAQTDQRGAWLIGVQTALLLILLAAFERGSSRLVAGGQA
jgi:UDP-GlcNAc:undecaprenyl-phosphate/decaprenyl-phosphate GlcNAc-1-phosphate transferase